MPVSTFVFRNLPGVAELERDQMIADKFHQGLPEFRIDEISQSLFGITAKDVQFTLPQWFAKGFDSVEDWNGALKSSQPDDWEDAEWMVSSQEELDQEAPARRRVYRQALEFEAKMYVPTTQGDNYGCMEFGKTFGFDFSDVTGNHPLRITKLFFRQALATARGVMGHLPDLGALGTQAWGTRLEEEARRFKKKR